MPYDPQKHHRRSTRLPGYNYAQAGVYFVTVCIHHRVCLFGSVNDGKMVLNDAGKMVAQWWSKLSEVYPTVQLDHSIVLPNHMHGLICVNEHSENHDVGANPCVRPQRENNAIIENNAGAHAGAPLHNDHAALPLLGAMIRWFKTMTTNMYIQGVKQNGWSAFEGKLWQRNYHEHVVRNDAELTHIRAYIINNPQSWDADRLNLAT